MGKEFSKESAKMKIEAMALFSNIKFQAKSNRWWFFREMKKLGREIYIEQNISAYRASLKWDYLFNDIDCQIYLEREIHQSTQDNYLWKISIDGIEGKLKTQIIQNQLKKLESSGFYMPNGNENLERQMNFSLGLYGSCLMHVDILFPTDKDILTSALQLLDLLDLKNQESTPCLEEVLKTYDQQRQNQLSNGEEENPDIIMGDWQTWK